MLRYFKGDFSRLANAAMPGEYAPFRGILNPLDEEAQRLILNPWFRNNDAHRLTLNLIDERGVNFVEGFVGEEGAIRIYEESHAGLEMSWAMYFL